MRDVSPPARPWTGRMRWCDLAFLHWPVSPPHVRPLIPRGLELDLFEGQAWIGVVPFRMEGVRVRGVPPLPTSHAFAEINVRTYVRGAGRAGVWFFSLDAESRLAVRGARFLYNLPYFDAEICITRSTTKRDRPLVEYESRRTHRDAPDAFFTARYEPIGDVYEARPGTLDHFFAERYCLFMCDNRRGLGLLDVDHQPWPLQPAAVDIERNTMAAAAGITLPDTPPLVHYAGALEVKAWTRVGISP